jgi:heme oxygenase
MSFLRKLPADSAAPGDDCGNRAGEAPSQREPAVSRLGETLRNATRSSHHGIDHHPLLTPLVRPELSLEHYGRVLRSFLWLYTPLQDDFALRIEQAGGGFELADRIGWLNTDLASLGLARDLPADAWQPPVISSTAELVGALYVIEGSTLGGQVISRQISASIGLTASRGARFFNGWGEQTEARWQAFWRFADAVCPAAGHAAAADAAVSFFAALRLGLDRMQEWQDRPCS